MGAKSKFFTAATDNPAGEVNEHFGNLAPYMGDIVDKRTPLGRHFDSYWCQSRSECAYLESNRVASQGGFAPFDYPNNGDRKTYNPEIQVRTKEYNLIQGANGFIAQNTDRARPVADIRGTVIHENWHRRQFDQANILLANPLNTGSDLIPLPEDFLKIMVCTEMGAYPGTTLIAAEAHRIDNSYKIDTHFKVSEYETRLQQLGSSVETLRAMAIKARDMHLYDKNGTSWSMKDHYQEVALDMYFDIASRRNIEYFRLEDDDHNLINIGNVWGKNVFEQDGKLHPLFCGTMTMRPEIRKQLDTLNERLGITKDRSYYRTFDEGLDARGLTQANYRALSTKPLKDQYVPERAFIHVPEAVETYAYAYA